MNCKTPEQDEKCTKIGRRIQKEICSCIMELEINKISESTWVVGVISQCVLYKVRIYLYFKIPLYKRAHYLYRLGHTIMGLDYLDTNKENNISEVIKIEYVEGTYFWSESGARDGLSKNSKLWVEKCIIRLAEGGPMNIPFNSPILRTTWNNLCDVHSSIQDAKLRTRSSKSIRRELQSLHKED